MEELTYWVKLLQWQEEREGLERELVSLLDAVSCLGRGEAASGEVLERERREVWEVARRMEQEVVRLLEEGNILKVKSKRVCVCTLTHYYSTLCPSMNQGLEERWREWNHSLSP